MKYRVYQPEPFLYPYIDKYYEIDMGFLSPAGGGRMPSDSCMDIFINTGNSVLFINQQPILPGRLYLSGLMTSFITLSNANYCQLIGIQFKPGGLSAFYHVNAEEYAGIITEYHDTQLETLLGNDDQLVGRLNKYFCKKLQDPRPILPILNTIIRCGGRLSVDWLAKESCLTRRTLERLFYNRIGIGPKELLNIIRYKNMLNQLLKEQRNNSLLHLAFQAGYYDHAHLTRETKRYSGLTPSEITHLKNEQMVFLTDWLSAGNNLSV